MQQFAKRYLSRGLLVLAGAACPATPQSFSSHFLPPAAVNTPPLLPAAAVKAEQSLFRKEPATLLHLNLESTSASIEVQMRLAKSDAHLQQGLAFFSQRNFGAARSEFDKAIEALTSASHRVTDRSVLLRKYEELSETIYRLEVEQAESIPGRTEPDLGEAAPLDDIAGLTFPVEPGLKQQVKEQLSATVSQLPLEVTDPVVGFINYFSSPRGRKKLEYGFRRAGRFAEMIYRILDEEGLPRELIYLAQAESAFLPRAVSRMRAGGMWQFVKYRGREYGLMQTPSTDDRFDPEKSTRAAARHLRDLYDQFGDWYLAVAAYNCGPGNVERAIQRTGYADFWELYKRNVLPRETANYLPIILAITIMAKNQQAYGLDGITPDPPLKYDGISLTAPTHLALIADIAGVPLAEIRELNPAVLKLVAPAGYDIRVPRGDGDLVLAALDSVPSAKRTAWRVHRVASDDTVARIASRYRTTEKSINAVNGGQLVAPEEGDLLVIPVAYPGATAAQPSRTVPAKKPGRMAAANKKGKATASRSPQKGRPHVAAKSGPKSKVASSPVKSRRAPSKVLASNTARRPGAALNE